MGLSLMPPNNTHSFSTTSTTFQASNLKRPRKAGHIDQGPVRAHDADGLQTMPLPNLVVFLVTCRGDLKSSEM